jgi:hypothetical protein
MRGNAARKFAGEEASEPHWDRVSRMIAARRRLRSVPAGREAPNDEEPGYVIDEGRIRSLDSFGHEIRSAQ